MAKLTGGCVGKSGVGTRPSAAEGRRTVSAAGAGGGVCDGWVDSAGFRSGPGVASARGSRLPWHPSIIGDADGRRERGKKMKLLLAALPLYYCSRPVFSGS